MSNQGNDTIHISGGWQIIQDEVYGTYILRHVVTGEESPVIVGIEAVNKFILDERKRRHRV